MLKFLGINLEHSSPLFDVKLSHDEQNDLFDDEIDDFSEANQREAANNPAQPSDVALN